MELIDGKKISANIKEEISEEVKRMVASGQRPPHLAAILVGDDPASETYVNAKVKACEKIGFESTLIKMDKTVSEAELLSKIDELNNDPGLDGFIVQVPLPEHIDEQKVTQAVNPEKDVDGFHPVNLGRMVLNLPTFLPATPFGITEMLRRSGIDTEGKQCVVMGRSHTVGTPMSLLMMRNGNPGNATVTTVHSRTKNAEEITRQADILIVAVGKPQFVKANMVKDGAVVIDVGIHRLPDDSKKSGFRLAGDVDFDEVAPKCSYISPVPGGVGPMTIASLLLNTLRACKNEVYN